ncbi:MAG: winged helix-turn-helix transcriptional regulator [Candidatus Micrarchaeota archaeon]|nr:winged helix-turn-helix transcriptional regulator [Candidatus Micrarchaeota archaeon]
MDKKTIAVVLGVLLVIIAFYFAQNDAYGVLAIASLLVGLLALVMASLLMEEARPKEEPQPIVEVRKGPDVEEILWLLPEKDRIIIGYLYRKGKVTQAELAKETGLSKATLSRHLKMLEEEGKVIIEKDEKANYVELSPKVKELLEKL